jgi:hypothetical protein
MGCIVNWISSPLLAVEKQRLKTPITFTWSNPLVRDAGWDWSFDRIDHILLRCESKGPSLKIGDCRIAFSELVDGIWASDHFGVMADLLPLA